MIVYAAIREHRISYSLGFSPFVLNCKDSLVLPNSYITATQKGVEMIKYIVLIPAAIYNGALVVMLLYRTAQMVVEAVEEVKEHNKNVRH